MIAIFLFMYLLVFQPHKIKGDSMQPNYPNGEYLLTDKVKYRFNSPQRGDVVVFKAPVADDEYIKRIIGLPGEIVSLRDGHIYINSRLLEEEYLSQKVITYGGRFLADNQSAKVPEDEYFVVGDNRSYSSDSRTWGFVPKESITGRAWLVYWPPKSAGKIKGVNYNI